MDLPSISQTDFSGGMTDEIVGGLPTQGEILENFVITSGSETNGRPDSRPGSEILDGNVVSTVKPELKTGNLINFGIDSYLLIRAGKKIFAKPVSTWTEIQGPSGNSVFNPATPFTDAALVSGGEWNGALYLAAYDPTPSPLVFASPQKVYRDTTGTWKVLNAGLPKFPDGTDATNRATLLASAITFANALKTKLTAHFAHLGDTVTISIASPAKVTLASHGLSNWDLIVFTTTGALPTGLTAGTPYWVKNVSTNDFEVTATYGAASINTSGTQSGVHKIRIHQAAQSHSFAANATDETSLITLTKDLYNAVYDHISDARLVTPVYHYVGGAYLNFFPNRLVSAETLIECIPVLNNLKLIYNLHLYARAQKYRVHAGRYLLNRMGTTDLAFSGVPVFNPKVPFSKLRLFADNVKEALNIHYQDLAGAGGHALFDDQFIIPTVVSNRLLDSGITDETYIVVVYLAAQMYAQHRLDAGAHDEAEPDTTALTNDLTGLPIQDGGDLFAWDLTTATGWQASFDVLRDLATKAELHVAGSQHLSTGGTLGLSASTTPTACVIAENGWAFTYKNIYTVEGGGLFEDVSTPAVFNSGPYINTITFGSGYGEQYPSADYRSTIEQVPALGALENLPSTTVLKEIWRTKVGGTVFYKAGEVLNSEKTVANDTWYDHATDAQLSSELLYTTTSAPNDPPPKCVGMWIVDNTAYYGGAIEVVNGADVHLPKRVRQSIPYDPDSVPETFFVDLENDFVCGGAANGKPIVVTKKGVYRLEGGFDDTGQGALTWDRIADTVGGVSVNGGAILDDVYYFAGHDGFYMCDGYSVRPIAMHLKTTYKACVTTDAKKRAIQATVDRDNRRILWTVAHETTDYADKIFVLDLNQPNADGRACFTRFSNSTHFRPTAITIFQGVLHRGDYQGFVFKHTPGLTNDPKITRTGSGTLSGDVVYIPWQFRSVALDCGTVAHKKWATTFTLEFANQGNLSVQPKSINDLNTGNITSCRTMRFRQTYGGTISEIFRFRKATDASKTNGGFRFMRKQIDLTPGEVVIISSDDSSPLTLASVSGSLCTLDTSAYDWPAACEDWSISFETDNYVTQYLITDRVSGDTLQLGGSPGFVGSKKWQLKGIPKDEKARLLAYTMFFVPMDKPIAEVPSLGESGANA